VCGITGAPMVVTVSIWNRPYWDEQLRFWKARHKYGCGEEDKHCTCDAVIAGYPKER
jgi:hypothetical protein